MTTDGPARSTSAAIDLHDVCVHYGDVVALAPTDLHVGAGESVAIVGSNGSGKTTLMSVIAGLVAPNRGTVTVGGRVAMVTQVRDHHRWMPLSVDEVVRMGRYAERGLLGRISGHDRTVITAAARALEVDDLRRRSFGELSGGQQQRVLVAQALAAQPDVLLLDEPITGLDLASQLRILEVIRAESEAGRIVVFSTHHLAEARRADRVLLMSGCVLADGTPDDVLVPHLLAEAFGDRVIRTGDGSIVVDEHGHDHGEIVAAELVPHHELHHHEHPHTGPVGPHAGDVDGH